jgi:hypothetical protein
LFCCGPAGLLWRRRASAPLLTPVLTACAPILTPLLTACAPILTPLAAACAPILTPLHPGRLGLSV